MLPKYKALLDYDLSILVFSGDVDAIVPVSSLSHSRGPIPSQPFPAPYCLDLDSLGVLMKGMCRGSDPLKQQH